MNIRCNVVFISLLYQFNKSFGTSSDKPISFFNTSSFGHRGFPGQESIFRPQCRVSKHVSRLINCLALLQSEPRSIHASELWKASYVTMQPASLSSSVYVSYKSWIQSSTPKFERPGKWLIFERKPRSPHQLTLPWVLSDSLSTQKMYIQYSYITASVRPAWTLSYGSPSAQTFESLRVWPRVSRLEDGCCESGIYQVIRTRKNTCMFDPGVSRPPGYRETNLCRWWIQFTAALNKKNVLFTDTKLERSF
jgi:hypothetical protein